MELLVSSDGAAHGSLLGRHVSRISVILDRLELHIVSFGRGNKSDWLWQDFVAAGSFTAIAKAVG